MSKAPSRWWAGAVSNGCEVFGRVSFTLMPGFAPDVATNSHDLIWRCAESAVMIDSIVIAETPTSTPLKSCRPTTDGKVELPRLRAGESLCIRRGNLQIDKVTWE